MPSSKPLNIVDAKLKANFPLLFRPAAAPARIRAIPRRLCGCVLPVSSSSEVAHGPGIGRRALSSGPESAIRIFKNGIQLFLRQSKFLHRRHGFLKSLFHHLDLFARLFAKCGQLAGDGAAMHQSGHRRRFQWEWSSGVAKLARLTSTSLLQELLQLCFGLEMRSDHGQLLRQLVGAHAKLGKESLATHDGAVLRQRSQRVFESLVEQLDFVLLVERSMQLFAHADGFVLDSFLRLADLLNAAGDLFRTSLGLSIEFQFSIGAGIGEFFPCSSLISLIRSRKSFWLAISCGE